MAKRHLPGVCWPKHGSQPFPPKGQGQPTFHTRTENLPVCLPVEGRAVAWLTR